MTRSWACNSDKKGIIHYVCVVKQTRSFPSLDATLSPQGKPKVSLLGKTGTTFGANLYPTNHWHKTEKNKKWRRCEGQAAGCSQTLNEINVLLYATKKNVDYILITPLVCACADSGTDQVDQCPFFIPG